MYGVVLYRSNKFKRITCKCSKQLLILNPVIVGKKSHIHCSDCNLEWHLTLGGKVYSHQWKNADGIPLNVLHKPFATRSHLTTPSVG